MEDLKKMNIDQEERIVNKALEDKTLTDMLDKILSRIEVKNNKVKINDIEDLHLDEKTEELFIYYLGLNKIEIEYDIMEKQDLDKLSCDDTEKLFLLDVSRYGLLKPEEEKRLTLKYYYEHDAETKNIIINHNLRLVLHLVKRYVTDEYSYADLIQDGTLGLIKGIEKFDPNKGFKLSTYVSWWIVQSAKREFNNNSRIVRLPVNIHNRISLMKNIISDYLNEYGTIPTDEYLMKKLEIKDYKTLKLLKKYLTDVCSLDALISNEDYEDEECIGNFIPSDEKPIATQIEEKSLMDAFDRALSKLSKRDQDIIRRRNALRPYDRKYTFEEIGKKYGVTRERIRQIELRGERKLRANNELKQYL